MNNYNANEIIKKSKDSIEIKELLQQVELTLRTWQPSWSPFLSEGNLEKAIEIMKLLNDIKWEVNGGYPGAERGRIYCLPSRNTNHLNSEEPPMNGIRIEGNFLFDKPKPRDFRDAFQNLAIPSNQIGDIWICNDRGAEGICTLEASKDLHGRCGLLREVSFKCEVVKIYDLRLPSPRIPKRFTSVEASKRVDAITSAGFGISRSKTVKAIQSGLLRLNWEIVTQASKEIKEGDKIQLENKGTVEILSFTMTKKERWRVELLRK
tara:strand:+ start:648 stop:1439 length:792 start_codon:yes stop_codon:yes gene_type:complete